MEVFLALSLGLLLLSVLIFTCNDNSKVGTITFILSFTCIIFYNIWYFNTDVKTYSIPITTGFIGDKPTVQFYNDPETGERVILNERLKASDDHIECRIPRKYSLQNKLCVPVTPILIVNEI